MVDQSVLIVATMLVGVGTGIGLVSWTESQGKRTKERPNIQPCTECSGETRTPCTVCNGDGKDSLQAEKACGYCEGIGSVKCFNCAGSGIQPRFLDRYVFLFPTDICVHVLNSEFFILLYFSHPDCPPMTLWIRQTLYCLFEVVKW